MIFDGKAVANGRAVGPSGNLWQWSNFGLHTMQRELFLDCPESELALARSNPVCTLWIGEIAGSDGEAQRKLAADNTAAVQTLDLKKYEESGVLNHDWSQEARDRGNNR